MCSGGPARATQRANPATFLRFPKKNTCADAVVAVAMPSGHYVSRFTSGRGLPFGWFPQPASALRRLRDAVASKFLRAEIICHDEQLMSAVHWEHEQDSLALLSGQYA